MGFVEPPNDKLAMAASSIPSPPSKGPSTCTAPNVVLRGRFARSGGVRSPARVLGGG